MINVTVIGFGYVGSSLSLLLLNNQHSLRLNIMEPHPSFEGAFLDLSHGLPLYNEKELYRNNEELFIHADFIFYAAGIPNVHGESRLSTAKQNVQLSKEHTTFEWVAPDALDHLKAAPNLIREIRWLISKNWHR